jgi:hypothetical protein
MMAFIRNRWLRFRCWVGRCPEPKVPPNVVDIPEVRRMHQLSDQFDRLVDLAEKRRLTPVERTITRRRPPEWRPR